MLTILCYLQKINQNELEIPLKDFWTNVMPGN